MKGVSIQSEEDGQWDELQPKGEGAKEELKKIYFVGGDDLAQRIQTKL